LLSWFRRALLGALALAPFPVAAQPTLNDLLPNFAGLGIGATPAYSGASQADWGIAPGARLALGGERFFGLYGPYAELNLLDHPILQAGPVALYRAGRSGADDMAVRALGDLDPSVELGGRLGVSWVHTQGPVPFRLRAGVSLTGDVTGQYGGLQILPSASLWVPLSERVFVGAGAFARFGSASQNNYFYGVSAAGSATSGLPAFAPKGGLTSVSAWPAVVWRMTDRWALGAGLVYSRLSDEVAGSPIVQQGSRDQLTGGIAIAYTW
jgi:outer membrane scaffolding protein for murein synthesis (MipA/OmpV family)